MKISNRQQQEVDFLIKHFCRGKHPTQEEIEDYINKTVHGKKDGVEDKFSTNILRNAKQRLDLNVSLWREDLTSGLLGKNELLEDFNCEYGTKLVNSIIKSVTPEYRRQILNKQKGTVLAFSNFDDIVKVSPTFTLSN